MLIGCIDIGSNTTRLLVADCADRKLLSVHQERVFTQIGHELRHEGRIGSAKIGEVVLVVAAQLASARALGAPVVRAVATAAIRSAENGAELVDAIRVATGLIVEILSGQEEARLAFVGAAGTLEHHPAGDLGVVDVGGGSSELVVGDVDSGVRWWTSIALGSGTIAYSYLASDPPSTAQLDAARCQINAALAEIRAPRPAVAVAVGGSATSLARLVGPVLDAAALAQSLELLAAASSTEVALRFGIDSQRARLLPAGLLILEGWAELLGVQLTVGRGGIREGVLLEAGAG